MPLSEPITVAREMKCSDWPSLYNVPNLASKVGLVPPALFRETIKGSLNKNRGLVSERRGEDEENKRHPQSVHVWDTAVGSCP